MTFHVEQARFAWPRSDRPALDGVNLQVETGAALALLGPNGSGKSTLLKGLAGLLALETSSAVLPSDDRSRLGVVFQTPSLDRHLTVGANLVDHLALFGVRGAAARERVDAALRRAGVHDLAARSAGALSGGQQRRVDLVRALLPEPDVLLLDEPTTGLDLAARRSFLDDVLDERALRGMTVFMTTHLVDEADRMDRVILMDQGRVVADGAPQDLRRALGALRLTLHGGAEPGDDWTDTPDGWARPIEAGDTILDTLTAQQASFTVGPPTLADVFAHHTGRALETRS